MNKNPSQNRRGLSPFLRSPRSKIGNCPVLSGGFVSGSKTIAQREHAEHEICRQVTRRWFFQDCGMKLGTMALATLLRDALGPPSALAAGASANVMAPKQPQFAAKAKRVIYLFQAGAPSHLELF